MYTECPHCQTAFRVSAALLRQAHGQVQCGGCGRRFDALETLSEEAPAPATDTSSSQSVNLFERRSRELLKSLGELTGGDNVRIEDTGVEWRVLDMDGVNDDDGESAPERADTAASLAFDDDQHRKTVAGIEPDWLPESDVAQALQNEDDDWANLGVDGLEVIESPGDEDAVEIVATGRQTGPEPVDEPPDLISAATFSNEAPQAAFDLQQGARGADAQEARVEQLRFDDNTPLPDEYYRPVVLDEEGNAAQANDAAQADDAGEAAAAAETLRVSIDTGTEADWQDLLAEVDDAEPEAASDSADELAVQHTDVSDSELSLSEEDVAAADTNAAPLVEVHTARPAPAEPDWSEAEVIEMAGDDDAGDLAQDEVQAADYAAAALTAAATDTPVRAASAMREADRRRGAPSPAKQSLDNDDTDDALVESIVMEGDTVTDLLEMAERASFDDVPPPDDSEDVPGRYNGLVRGAGLVAILILALALVAQYVHANRETLATRPFFQSTVAPLYEAFSQPVTPAWDIGGWQFESTTGSTDDTDQRLTIYSRIANESAAALPYPLIHVSLTDRWDDVIGSRVLAPGDYLAGNGNVNKLVAAGASFEAVITVAAPAAAATGFKLNVCYGLAERRLRCAIEDFRN